MTKLKNTKKGMAKKALSISLVAAMLATSNVPVWAAEDIFSDGSNVAVQEEVVTNDFISGDDVDTYETPAPVAEPEDTQDAPALASAVTQNGVTADLSVDQSAVIWGLMAGISGTIMKDGSPLTSWNYAWKDKDGVAIPANSGTVDTGKNEPVAKMSIAPKKDYAGQTLTLWIYNEGEFNINTGVTVTVKKRALGEVNTNKTITYNGFDQSLTKADITSVQDDGGVPLVAADYSNFIVTSTSGKNAGDKVTLTITADNGSAYEGSASKTVEVGKKDIESADVEISVKDGQEYQYTGAAVEVPTNVVTLKESKKSDSNPTGLGGNDLSSAITKVETADKTVTEQTLKVTVDPAKLSNFDKVGTVFSGNVISGTASAKVKIVARDLKNNCTITPKSDIPVNTPISNLKNYLVFKDGDTVLTLADSDYTIAVKDEENKTVTGNLSKAGNYTVTITAAGTNTKNEQTITVHVAQKVIASVTSTAFDNYGYKKDYTGEAIQPSKTDIGELSITDTDGTTTKLQASQWTITGYTDNKDATIYNGLVGNVANIKKTAKVNIKIVDGIFKDQTAQLAFVINPLSVAEADVTVPETVTFNKGYVDAGDYQVPVAVVAKGDNGKITKGLTADDYKVKYAYVDNTLNPKNQKGNTIQATVTITNTNYISGSADGKTVDKDAAKTTKIVGKLFTDSMINVNPSTYTYTGGTITPEFAVMDGVYLLEEKTDYTVKSITNAVNVGTGKITIENTNFKGNYYGTASAEFTITPATTSDVKVEIDPQQYTGKQKRPAKFTAKLNGNDVSSQFEITGYGANIEVGKGTVTLAPVTGNKNFIGGEITAEFKIASEVVTGTINVYNEYGIKVDPETADAFSFDGTAKTFAKALLSGLQKDTTDPDKSTKAKIDDFEIKYADNVTGNYDANKTKGNVAYVYAVAKEGTGYSGNKTITTSDGTVIKDVVAMTPFYIESVKFVKENVTVKNGTYAGGLPVKPQILIQIGGSTLTEGKDYVVTLYDVKSGGVVTPMDVTVGKPYTVKIEGKNGYKGSTVFRDNNNDYIFTWGIDKKDIAGCTVTVTNGVAAVTNGPIPVPATEYTVKDNGDKTYTVTATEASKNYKGSKTVTGDGQKPTDKPVAPTIQSVTAKGNNVTVQLAGETEGSTGYDYVISRSNVFTDKASRVGVNANVLSTKTTFRYVGQGVYYAYLHSWKRVNGKKVFSDWSNAYPFMVTAITPEEPTVTSVKVTGKTVKVTYTKSANATGYDIVLGKSVKKVNGEIRPVGYGKLVKKVYKGTTVTATFTNVPKGTYYAGLHAYNRTSENNNKVFSNWSNTRKAIVK